MCKMGKKNTDDFKCEVGEVLGTLKDSNTGGWTKSVLYITWGENGPSLDIRNVNLPSNKFGKGISLSNEETDVLVDILLDNDFGTYETLQNALSKKRSIFSITPSEIEDVLTDNEKLIIDIRLGDD